jgi:hypothetical protein
VENIMNMNKMNNESPPIPTVLSEQKTPPVKPEASKVTEAPMKAAPLEKIATPPIVTIKSVEVEVVAKNNLPVKAPEAKAATPDKTQKRQAPRPPDQVQKETDVLHQPTPAEVKQKSPEVVPKPIKIEEKAPELPPKPQTPDVQNQTKSPELPPKPKSPVAATAEVMKSKVSEAPKQKTPETDPKVVVPKASEPPAVEKPKTPEAVVQPKLPEAAKPKTPEPVASVSSSPKQQSPVQKNAAPEAPIAAEEVISLTPELKRKAPQPPKKEILETKEQPVEVKPAPQKTDAKEEVKPTTPKPRSPSPSDDSLGEDDLVSDKLNTLKRRPKGKIMTASGK